MASGSSSTTDSSASGLIRIASRTKRPSSVSATSSTATPDSLLISMLILASVLGLARSLGLRLAPSAASGARALIVVVPASALGLRTVLTPGFAAAWCAVLGGFDGVPALVGVDDLADQPVPDDVGAGQVREMDVVDVAEDLADDLQPAARAARQVDLGDVAGDDHLRAEAQPGQEHLHLLGGGVLRLVEDDERVVQGAAAHVGQWRDLDRARPGVSRGIDSGSSMSCSASSSGRRYGSILS